MCLKHFFPNKDSFEYINITVDHGNIEERDKNMDVYLGAYKNAKKVDMFLSNKKALRLSNMTTGEREDIIIRLKDKDFYIYVFKPNSLETKEIINSFKFIK